MLGITLAIPDFNQITQDINWSASSRDLVIILFFILSIIIHVLAFKKEKIYAFLFSIYTSYLFVLFFPYNLWLSHLSWEQMSWVKAGGFVLLIIIFTTIFSRAHIFASSSQGLISRIFQSVIFGILNLALLLSLLSSLLPSAFISQFSPFTRSVFTRDLTRFIWITLPILIIIFSLRVKKRGPGRPPIDY